MWAALSILGAAGLVAQVAILPTSHKEEAAPLTTPVKSVTVTVTHKDYPTFATQYALEVGQRTYIHDTHYWVKLEDFVADFVMDPTTKQVTSRSNDLKNPAAKVQVGYLDKPIYTTWIFREQETRHDVKAPGFIFTIAEVW